MWAIGEMFVQIGANANARHDVAFCRNGLPPIDLLGIQPNAASCCEQRYSIPIGGNRFEVRLPSRYKESFPCTAEGARCARKSLRNFAQEWLAGRDLADFETAVGEVLANAVEHSKSSTLTVDCSWCAGKLVTEIQDDGLGFLPPSTVRRPSGDALRGYGLFIMHQVLDELDFLDGGRRVRLVKNVRASGSAEKTKKKEA